MILVISSILFLLLYFVGQIQENIFASQDPQIELNTEHGEVCGLYKHDVSYQLPFIIRNDYMYLGRKDGSSLVLFYKYAADIYYLKVLDHGILRYKGMEYQLPWRTNLITSPRTLRHFLKTKVKNIRKLSHLRFKRSLPIPEKLSYHETTLLAKMSKTLANKLNANISKFVDTQMVHRFHWLIRGLVRAVGPPHWTLEADHLPELTFTSNQANLNHTSGFHVNSSHGNCQDIRHTPSQGRCFGMCGMMCWCWPWVCGDCCLHKGCVQHDSCCQKHGYASIYCFCPWVFGFSCKQGYHGYPDCMYH